MSYPNHQKLLQNICMFFVWVSARITFLKEKLQFTIFVVKSKDNVLPKEMSMWQEIRTCYKEELLMCVLKDCYGGTSRPSGQFAGLCERSAFTCFQNGKKILESVWQKSEYYYRTLRGCESLSGNKWFKFKQKIYFMNL